MFSVSLPTVLTTLWFSGRLRGGDWWLSLRPEAVFMWLGAAVELTLGWLWGGFGVAWGWLGADAAGLAVASGLLEKAERVLGWFGIGLQASPTSILA